MKSDNEKDFIDADTLRRRLEKAIEQLYRAISNDKISVVPDMEHEYIVVTINGAIYRVNVECENIRSMVRSVVSQTILKI